MGQLVSIDVTDIRPGFHCPVCGKMIFTKTGDENTEPCEHLVLISPGIENSVDILSKEVLALLGYEEDDLSTAPWDEEVVLDLPSNYVLFTLDSEGLGRGSGGETLSIGIKFRAIEEDEG